MKKKIQKPFDVKAAKNGARVETRDGHLVRILCYDRISSCPILALIFDGKAETCYPYNLDGSLGFGTGKANSEDLVIVEEVEVSKFNPGDWLITTDETYEDKCFWLVTKVTSDCYELQDLQDLQAYKVEAYHKSVDNHYRFWTLNDAKPGDVLVCGDDNRPFIFGGLYYDGAPFAYCGIDTTNSIYIKADRPWTRKPVRPATYKERQLLFNKLREGGYKWDAETLILWKKCN